MLARVDYVIASPAPVCLCIHFFFFNDTATTEIYTLSLHDALPISVAATGWTWVSGRWTWPSSTIWSPAPTAPATRTRSEEHTSELQSRQYLVCRLLLEKKKKSNNCKSSYTKTKTERIVVCVAI